MASKGRSRKLRRNLMGRRAARKVKKDHRKLQFKRNLDGEEINIKGKSEILKELS